MVYTKNQVLKKKSRYTNISKYDEKGGKLCDFAKESFLITWNEFISSIRKS